MREKNTGDAKERRKERERERKTEAYGRADGLPGFRQEDVTVNPRPPASDEPTLSASQGLPRSLLLLLLLRPVRTCYAYTYMCTGRGTRREARGTPIHAGLRRQIITERIVIAFFAMVRNGPVACDGPASPRRGKGEEEDDNNDDDDDNDDDEEDIGLLRREAEHAITSSWHKRAMRYSVEAGCLLLENWVARPRESFASS